MREIERLRLEQVRAAVPTSEPGLWVGRELRDQLLIVLGARLAMLLLFDDATADAQYVAVMIAFAVRIDARRPASISTTTSASTAP